MLHPQITAVAALRQRRPAAEDIAADPAGLLKLAREEGDAAAEEECGPAFPLPVVADLDAGGVPARLYATAVNTPVVVYLHGGGWIYGSIETHDRLCRRIAERSGCAVLSVDYRLAPEDPFPAALEDVEKVLAYLRAEGPGLGVDPSRIAIAGDSAGGNLATVIARRQRDAATPLDFQALIYPAIDPLCSSEAHAELSAYGLSREMMLEAWVTYVPERAHRFSPDVAPLAADLAGMPPTLIISAEFDVLRDEGADYADALVTAGVPVVHTVYAQMNHGFARHQSMVDAARAAADQVAAALRAALTF